MSIFTNVSGGDYTAKIIKCGKVSPIEGADKIGTIIVDYNTVIVAKNTNPEEIRIYFSPESQISDKILSELNEYRVTSKDNFNADKNAKGGFFEENRRVKAIRMRGVKSNGYTIPAADFAKVYNIPIEAIEQNLDLFFDTVNGELVCNKFVVTKKESSGKTSSKKQQPKLTRLVEGQFNFHIKTSNLRKCMSEINLDDEIVISNKIHGSSFIVANVLVKRQLTFVERIAKWLGVNVQDTQYDHLAGSRTVIRNKFLEDPKATNEGFYGKDFWTPLMLEVRHAVPKGYTVYGEYFGYVKGLDTPVQKSKKGVYDYGCAVGECKYTVYRVTLTNSDGMVLDLTNRQVEDFCSKYGFEMAEKYFEGTVQSFLEKYSLEKEEDWKSVFVAKLEELYNEKDCPLCVNKVPEEGVVIRVDNRPSFTAYKLKSYAFLEAERDENDAGETNIEDEN